MLLKVTSIDSDGFNGRNYPPFPALVGEVVTAVKMEAWMVPAQSEMEPVIAEDDRLTPEAVEGARFEIVEEEATLFMRVWTCLTKQGAIVELMDHEVELFRS